METNLREILQELPPIIARQRIEDHLGGIISARYLANLDCLGKGPQKVRIGRKVAYLREDLISWLERRMKQEEI
ncbi:MAG: hypothetical protein M0017_07005 [Desulfobacteraceae bacterium]|nr:hypothetical protein [Desulfobacteraceae bacterium]